MSARFTQESFEQKFKPTETGCWEWLKTKNQDGYGRVKRFGKLESAHRVSYELYKGPIGGLHVLHSCDNPSCVNPEHLRLGTHKENQEEKARKGRGVGHSMPGTKHPSHKLTEAQALAIKTSDLSVAHLQQLYPVSEMLIRDIRAGKRWKHLTPPH